MGTLPRWTSFWRALFLQKLKAHGPFIESSTCLCLWFLTRTPCSKTQGLLLFIKLIRISKDQIKLNLTGPVIDLSPKMVEGHWKNWSCDIVDRTHWPIEVCFSTVRGPISSPWPSWPCCTGLFSIGRVGGFLCLLDVCECGSNHLVQGFSRLKCWCGCRFSFQPRWHLISLVYSHLPLGVKTEDHWSSVYLHCQK